MIAMKRIVLIIIIAIFPGLFWVTVNGQSISLRSDLLSLTTLSDSTTKKQSAEKLYLQFDKPYYALGDTIWYKAYLLNAAYLTASAESGIMYVDIANDSDKVINQYRIEVNDGLAWGNISLNDKDFSAGTYTVRAYTNWMRNRGVDDFFYKRFYISSAGETNLLVDSRLNQSILNGDNLLNARLLFSNTEKIPYAVEPLQLQIMAGSKRLYRQKLQTGANGVLDVNFKLPPKANNLSIIAESEKKDKKVVIPINLDRPENTDVQFLPEGGDLVAGLPAHVGFKAIGEDGKGVNTSGVIVDQDQKQVAAFQSLHNGMGSFDLPVQAGETYIAKITLPGGMMKTYPLPVIKTSGTTLHVQNDAGNDSLKVSVSATNDIIQSGSSYYLIGKARGIVCYAAIISFHNNSDVKRNIAKRLFPTGVTRFTLMTAKYQPLNERIVFIDHHDDLNINVTTNKPVYGARDSIALHLKVTDKEGNPVAGNFSLAVTDDAQVKTDSLSENISTRILLTSDLKGFIEEPGYYLSVNNPENKKALDNLLLTQGWVGYNWQQILSPPAITYQPETDLSVKGRVSNGFNKPLKGTDVLLFAKSPTILMDTLTNKEGKFFFDHFPRVDTPIFIIKAVNKNGKSFNVNITMDEINPPVFKKPFAPQLLPWYVNSDTTFLIYTKKNTLAKQLQYFPESGHILKEVKIKAKKILRGSQNLNGPGEADIVMDEKEMEKALKKSWLQLLEGNVKGFHEMWLPPHYRRWYYMRFNTVFFIIDGVMLNDVYQPLDFFTLRTYLQSHNAEDIKGIEVMSSQAYAAKYSIRFRPLEALDTLAFVEITTRSGHGPVIDNTPGMYLYKPLAISWPKQFYKPKYLVKDALKHSPDLRSTIDWEPSVTTDQNGEATVSFYSADKSSKYTVIVEGCDLNGNLGYKAARIRFSSPGKL